MKCNCGNFEARETTNMSRSITVCKNCGRIPPLYRPETGETCLMNISNIDDAWYECTIDYIGDSIVVASCKDVKERSGHLDSVFFKPIPNPVDEMVLIINGLNDNYNCCKALYAAGYRKTPLSS